MARGQGGGRGAVGGEGCCVGGAREREGSRIGEGVLGGGSI